MDAYQKVLLGVGAACLAVLAVSPFLNWVNILGGGMMGIEGDGKIVLILCLCVGGGLVAELAIKKRSVASVIVAQAWGTIACLWMLGEVWRVQAIRASPDIRDNIFGEMLATQVSPGAGLILGMLGGLGLAIAFALLSIQRLKKTRLYVFTQAGSLLLGIGIVALAASHASSPGSPEQDAPSASDYATIPAVQAAREAARRAACSSNLKQIALAMHSYHSVNGCFPPAVLTDDLGKPMKSWRVTILPYLEETELYQQYDAKQPWDSPQNRAVGKAVVNSFLCTSDPATAGSTQTNYVRVVGRGTLGGLPNEAVKLKDIGDRSSTIMVVEVSGLNINWAQPRDITVDELMKLVAQRRVSRHPGGFQAVFADGSVHFLSYSDDPKILRAFLSPTVSNATPRNKAAPGTTAATPAGEKCPPSELKNWIAADKNSGKLGDIAVMVMSAKTGIVQLREHLMDAEDGTSKDPHLTIWLTIQNQSERKKLDYQSWASDLFSFGNDRVTLKDDAGNSYRGVNFGLSTKVKGAAGSESVYPGKDIQDALVFELPIDKIEYLELVLPGKHIGEEGEFRFRIPKAMIKKE